VFAAPHPSRFDRADKEVRGFNLRHWRDGDIDLLSISDLNAQELDRFVDQWKTAP
jgi:anti-sigma factor RsiW